MFKEEFFLCFSHLAQGVHQLRRVLRVVESRGSQSFRKVIHLSELLPPAESGPHVSFAHKIPARLRSFDTDCMWIIHSLSRSRVIYVWKIDHSTYHVSVFIFRLFIPELFVPHVCCWKKDLWVYELSRLQPESWLRCCWALWGRTATGPRWARHPQSGFRGRVPPRLKMPCTPPSDRPSATAPTGRCHLRFSIFVLPDSLCFSPASSDDTARLVCGAWRALSGIGLSKLIPKEQKDFTVPDINQCHIFISVLITKFY